MQDMGLKRGRSRFWLYGPAALIIVLAVAWSVGWFFLRDKAAGMIDAQLAREARMGRIWICADRSIGGFPFRLEMNCSNLSLRQGRISASLGSARIVSQVYNPRHVILETTGPLQATDGVTSLFGSWREMEASISGMNRNGFERISLITKESSFSVNGVPQVGTFAFSAQSTGLHIRPTPGTAVQDHSFDIALAAHGVTQSELDAWTSDKEPLQFDAAFTLNKVPLPPGPNPVMALEDWRQAGGMLTITKFDTRKGVRVFNLTGNVKLDEGHRPEATIKAVQANYSELLLRAASGGDIRTKFLQPLKPVPSVANEAAMSLPSVRVADGEVRIGNLIKIPTRIQPLY